jgi:hypothetical protein
MVFSCRCTSRGKFCPGINGMSFSRRYNRVQVSEMKDVQEPRLLPQEDPRD